MWGTDELIARSKLGDRDRRTLAEIVVPEMKLLPNPVEPEDRRGASERIHRLASKALADRD